VTNWAADRESGTGAAVLGYPENGPYAAAPARLGETRNTVSEDSYGNGPISRPIASLRGVVRSGSKVGARRYKKMVASTNDAYCPTLRGRLGVTTELPEAANSALEIVVNGLDRTAIEDALRAGIEAACRSGILEISAGNYGGKLGKHHFSLHALFPEAAS